MGRAIRVTILDGDPIFSLGVARVLNEAAGYEIAACDASIEAIARIPPDRLPDVLLIDARLPGAVEAAHFIHTRIPSAKVLMMADTAACVSDEQVARTDASAWLRKSITGAELSRAIQAVYFGQPLLDLALSVPLIAVGGRHFERLAQPGSSLVTAREFEVMSYVCRGLKNKDVAAAMGLSEPTVKMHMSSIRKKLGARSRLGAVLLFTQRFGLPQP